MTLRLTRRAYTHMPVGVQSELARDQFIRAIAPKELGAREVVAYFSKTFN